MSSLTGAFVLTSLETNDAFTGSECFLGEFSFVFIGGFRSKVGSHPFWVLVGLSAESEEGVCDLSNVFLFPQVYGLEDVDVSYTVSFNGGLEAENKIGILIVETKL